MGRFISDMIHLTDGEFFIRYWWFIIPFTIAAIIFSSWFSFRN